MRRERPRRHRAWCATGATWYSDDTVPDNVNDPCYSMDFFSRSSVRRIDDPTTGWKGKGLWSSYSNYAAWHLDGDPGTLQKAVKFQVRPHPLAK